MRQGRLIPVIALIGLLGWLASGWWTSDARRIRRQLETLQQLVEKRPGESSLVGLSQARRITELFARDFQVRAAAFDFQSSDPRSLASGVHAYRGSAERITMGISTQRLELDEAAGRATHRLTVVFTSGLADLAGRDTFVWELEWIEEGGEWKIAAATLLDPAG